MKSAGESLASHAAGLIGEKILSGELSGGERLNIRSLVELTGIGATPLREGLSRLISRGLVRTVDKRGFRVAEMSAEDLRDIMQTRLPLESAALRQAIEHGDAAWEGHVLASLHELVTYMSWAPTDTVEAAAGYDRVHKAFHSALIACCGSPRTLAFLDVLYDQGFRYRRLMLSAGEPREILSGAQRIAEHQALAELAIARCAEEAIEALRQHLTTFPADVFPVRAELLKT